jgi:hypothetical protein
VGTAIRGGWRSENGTASKPLSSPGASPGGGVCRTGRHTSYYAVGILRLFVKQLLGNGAVGSVASCPPPTGSRVHHSMLLPHGEQIET